MWNYLNRIHRPFVSCVLEPRLYWRFLRIPLCPSARPSVCNVLYLSIGTFLFSEILHEAKVHFKKKYFHAHNKQLGIFVPKINSIDFFHSICSLDFSENVPDDRHQKMDEKDTFRFLGE